MRFEVDVAALRAAVSRAARAAAPRAKGVLSCVRVQAEPAGLVSVWGTDVNAWAWGRCPAQVGEPGEALVPARFFAALLGLLDRDRAAVSLEDGTLRLDCGGRFSLVTADPAAFPSPPLAEGEAASVPGEALRRAAEQVAVALPADPSNRLSAACWEPEGLLVGTDTVRLAVAPCPPSPGGRRLVLPERGVALLRQVPDGDVSLKASGTVLSVQWPDGGLVLRTLPAYPDWKRVAEVAPAVSVRAALADLRSAFERARAAAGQGLPAAKVQVGPAGMEVSLKGDAGAACEHVPCSAEGGLAVYFDARLVLDGLGALGRSCGDGDEVLWVFSGEAGASLMTLPREGSYRYVLLPLRPL